MHDFLTLKSKEMEVGGAPEIISVLPLGHVKSAKGEFDVDGESFAAMKAQIAQRGVDLVVDYEHQTLTGEQAPAAGWVKELFLSDGQIKARVEWRAGSIATSPRSSPSARPTARRWASTRSPSPTPRRSNTWRRSSTHWTMKKEDKTP